MSVRGRPARSIALGGDDQRVGGVQAAGDADDHLRPADRGQPLLQAADLDVVGLVAVLGEPVRVGGHEREPLDARGAAPGRRPAGRAWKPTRRKSSGAPGVGAAVVVEGAHPQPLLPQQVEVHVGDGDRVAEREALGLGQQRAVLVDHGLAVPGQVGGRLARARPRRRRRRPGSATDAERHSSLRSSARPDRDRAARQVDQHRGAGQRGLGARRDRDPHVLADLRVQHQPRHVLGREQQVDAERHGLRRPTRIAPAALVLAGGDLPPLVELAVVRQVGLRHDAEDPAAVDDHRAVVDPVPVAQRRADDQHRQQVGRWPPTISPHRRPRPRRAPRPAAAGPRSSSRSGTAPGRPRRRPRPRRSGAPGAGPPGRWRAGRR